MKFSADYFTNYGGTRGRSYLNHDLTEYGSNPSDIRAMLQILNVTCTSAYDIGAANGRMLVGLRDVLGITDLAGCEISDWGLENLDSSLPADCITKGDLFDVLPTVQRQYDLIFSGVSMYLEEDQLDLYFQLIQHLAHDNSIFITHYFYAIYAGMYWRDAKNRIIRKPFNDTSRASIERPKTWWIQQITKHFKIVAEGGDGALYLKKKVGIRLSSLDTIYLGARTPEIRFPSINTCPVNLKNPFTLIFPGCEFTFSWISNHEVAEHLDYVLTEEAMQGRLPFLFALFKALLSKEYVPVETFYLAPMRQYVHEPMYFTVAHKNLWYMTSDSMITGRFFPQPKKWLEKWNCE